MATNQEIDFGDRNNFICLLTQDWVEKLNAILNPGNIRAVIRGKNIIAIYHSEKNILTINVEPNGDAWFYYPFPMRIYLHDLTQNRSHTWLINLFINMDQQIKRIINILEF